MSKGTVTKVMKYELHYLDGCGDFHDMQKAVWELQRMTREILNQTIQIAYHWDYVSREHFKESGEYLDVKSETGYKTLDGHIYNSIKSDYSDIASQNLSATIQKAWGKYNSDKREVLRGTISLPSYKSNQPLVLHNSTVKFDADAAKPGVQLSLFSNSFKKQHGFSNVRFEVRLNDKSQKDIFYRVLSGEYKKGQCQLVYDKRKWFLYLTYSFTPSAHTLDPDKILGVDLGETYAVYASVFGEYGSFKIEGGEVTAFAKKLEARKHSMQKQSRYCGEGRIGHGTKTRVHNVYKAEDRIADFRKTINHRYSKALIDYAVKKGCGVIQMEDLSGIKDSDDFPKFLRHWTYYDLQMKIESKAKENGIVVLKINPQYTSQRCSKCGSIEKENRPNQSTFRCAKCGFSSNADFNASQNISIKGIAKIIQDSLGAKQE